MLADLAVAPFPLSLVRPPLRKLDKEGLPALPPYQIALVQRHSNQVTATLASHVREAFADFRK